MPAELFDMRLRAKRRDRAARRGAETFLHRRAFENCLESLELINRDFERALLLGCPDDNWPANLRSTVKEVDVADPGPLFAEAAGGRTIVEDRSDLGSGVYDLCIAIGTLDSVNDLRLALRSICEALRPNSLFLGAILGGDSLPALRNAMRAADSVMGAASPHVHPRIEAKALAPLLTESGFIQPVVDVDRVKVTYPSLDRLIEDLRGMGATNILTGRDKTPLTRGAWDAARTAFEQPDGTQTIEKFELLHFAAWTPATHHR